MLVARDPREFSTFVSGNSNVVALADKDAASSRKVSPARENATEHRSQIRSWSRYSSGRRRSILRIASK